MRINIGLILSAVIVLFYVILKTCGAENLENWLFGNLESWALSLILLLTLICMLTEKVEDFNLDRTAIAILILSGAMISASNNFTHFIVTIIIIIKLGRLTKKKWSNINQINWHWIVLSLAFTGLVLVPTTIIALYNSKILSINSNNVPNILVMIGRFMINIGVTAVWEEVFFRSLLWGYIKKIGLSDRQAFLFQFIIFWLLHYKGQSSNLSFYVSLPLEIFVQSWLVYKSKQLTPSIISHALYNTLSPLLYRFFV
jgi:membrane protease YdiL (CAAX protease family)